MITSFTVNYISPTMFAQVLSALLLSCLALGSPLARRDYDPFPLDDGFPSPSDSQVQAITLRAHGLPPNFNPGNSISPEGLAVFQLLTVTEPVESAFWNQLKYNITTCQPGFDVIPSNIDKDTLIAFLDQSLAMEELHAIAANLAVEHFNGTVIEPCTDFSFPVSNLEEALIFNTILQANVFATLGDAVRRLVLGGDATLAQLLVNVAAAEGEQAGQLRTFLNKTAIELPFTTFGSLDFTYTAIQALTVGSCPNIDAINLKTFDALTVLDMPGPANQTVQYQVAKDKWVDNTSYNVVYFNSANVPIVEPATWVSEDDTTVTISANFPYTANELNGLTIVSVTDKPGPWNTVAEAADVAIWAPGFILVN